MNCVDPVAELRRLGAELGQRLGQAVGDLHVAAAQRPEQLVLVVAGDAERVPGADHAHDQPQHAGVSGPRSTRSPTNTAVPPVGVARPLGPRVGIDVVARARPSSSTELVAAAVDVADDVERPGRRARSLYSRARGRSSAAVDLLDAAQDVHLAEALPRSARASGAAGRAGARTTCGPKSRSGRAALRSGHTRSGTSSTIATGSTSCSRASATSGLRASGCTLVASTTVSRPAAEPLARRCSAARRTRAVVAVWSFSSSATSPRQKSEEITSVGRKCRRGERRLARARRRRRARPGDSSGMATMRRHRVNTAICVGGPDLGSSVADRQVTAPRSRVGSATPSAHAPNSARVHSNRWSRWRTCRRAASRSARCTRRSAS